MYKYKLVWTKGQRELKGMQYAKESLEVSKRLVNKDGVRYRKCLHANNVTETFAYQQLNFGGACLVYGRHVVLVWENFNKSALDPSINR